MTAARIFRVSRLIALTIRDLSPSAIVRAIAGLKCIHQRTGKPRDRLLSAQSRNSYLQAIKQFVRWMHVEQRMPVNPLLSLKKWNVNLDRRHDRTRIFTEEFAKLVRAAEESAQEIDGLDGNSRALLYRIAYATGLRRAEIGSLTASSFQLDNGKPTMTVAASNTKNRQPARLRLHADLVPLLKARIRGLAADQLLYPGLWQKKTAKMMRDDLKAAGIHYRTKDGLYRDFHALRHSFISALWDAGATPPIAMRLARHSDIRLTLRYSHVDTEAEDEVIARLPQLPANLPHKSQGDE